MKRAGLHFVCLYSHFPFQFPLFHFPSRQGLHHRPYRTKIKKKRPKHHLPKKEKRKKKKRGMGVYVSFLRSTTTTLTLSAVCLAKASFVSSMEASEHALSQASPSPSFSAPSTPSGTFPFRHIRATPHAVSFDTTSHRPSLASIRHSSSADRSVIVTSGSQLTKGFK